MEFRPGQNCESGEMYKLEFHDADTDTDSDILADTSDTRDFLTLFLWQAERHAPTFSRRCRCRCRRRGMPPILTRASAMLVTEDSFGGRRGRVDDVTNDGGRLTAITPPTPAAAPHRRLVTTAQHVRAARLTGTDLRLDRPDHRLEARTLAPLPAPHTPHTYGGPEKMTPH